MLWCYTIVKIRLVPIETINPLHLSAPVLSQEFDVQQLSFVDVVHKCFSFFIYIRPLIFPFEWFLHMFFEALCSLLFGVSQGSVLKTVFWPKIVYFYKLLLGWERVDSLALIPHLPIHILKDILNKQWYDGSAIRSAFHNNDHHLTICYFIIFK